MKIRIKGNTVRVRLSKPEVETFCKTGYLEEQTEFIPEPFIYAVKTDESVSELKIIFRNGRLDLLVPAVWVKDWTYSSRIGFNSTIETPGRSSLSILLEKDFKCLDETMEDQSDQYENPLKINS